MESKTHVINYAPPGPPWAIRPWCLRLALTIAVVIWLEWIAYGILAFGGGIRLWPALIVILLWPVYFLIYLGIAYGLAWFFERASPEPHSRLVDGTLRMLPNALLLLGQAVPLLLSSLILWLALRGNFTLD